MRTKLWVVWVVSLVMQAAIVIYYFVTGTNTNYFANIWIIIALFAAIFNILHYASMKYKWVALLKLGLTTEEQLKDTSDIFPKDKTCAEITARVLSKNKNLMIGANLYTAGFWSLHKDTCKAKDLNLTEIKRLQSQIWFSLLLQGFLAVILTWQMFTDPSFVV